MPVVDLPEILAALEGSVGLSSDELARALGVTPLTVKRWRIGSHFPHGESRRRLDALWELKQRLDEGFSNSPAARSWMGARSRYLGGFTPRDALVLGYFDRVNSALDALDAGVFL